MWAVVPLLLILSVEGKSGADWTEMGQAAKGREKAGGSRFFIKNLVDLLMPRGFGSDKEETGTVRPPGAWALRAVSARNW
jgi:hypothetical protein